MIMQTLWSRALLMLPKVGLSDPDVEGGGSRREKTVKSRSRLRSSMLELDGLR